MDGLLQRLLWLTGFFKPRQLTTEDVLLCVPTDWITTLYGEHSLRKRLRHQYGLRGKPSDGELHHLLCILQARGLIELETRLWRNQYDQNWYPHQQCRKARGGTPVLVVVTEQLELRLT